MTALIGDIAKTEEVPSLTKHLTREGLYIFATMNTNFFYIGYYVGESDTKVYIRKCAILAVMQEQGNPQARVHISKMPGEFLGKLITDSCLDKSQLAYIVLPMEKLAKDYIQSTSGIVPASSVPPMPGLR